MPKSRTATAAAAAALAEEPVASPLQSAREAADAMYRAACESCHQHDRVARIITRSSIEDELKEAQRLCAQCTASLRERAKSYEEIAGPLHPTGVDEQWWHRANALWLASREYLRRNSCCESSTRELKQHDRERLGALHADYELEGSAVLALRQAAEAYKQSRPDAF